MVSTTTKAEQDFTVDKVRYQTFLALLRSIGDGCISQTFNIIPTWHWLFTQETPSDAELGLDGHPFIRPTGVPQHFTRRLWTSSSIYLAKPVCFGQKLYCTTTTEAAILKQGRSGELAFVPKQIEIFDGDLLVLRENRTAVYRPPVPLSQQPKSSIEEKPEIKLKISHSIAFNEVSLFRYSALVQVTHRIHYDYVYTTEVEKFPGLVIQGPFLGQVLIHYALSQYRDLCLTSINVQALRPNFLGSPILLNVGHDPTRNCFVAWSEDINGITTMKVELNAV